MSQAALAELPEKYGFTYRPYPTVLNMLHGYALKVARASGGRVVGLVATQPNQDGSIRFSFALVNGDHTRRADLFQGVTSPTGYEGTLGYQGLPIRLDVGRPDVLATLETFEHLRTFLDSVFSGEIVRSTIANLLAPPNDLIVKSRLVTASGKNPLSSRF